MHLARCALVTHSNTLPISLRMHFQLGNPPDPTYLFRRINLFMLGIAAGIRSGLCDSRI
jgi:hypothetical protein